MRKLLTILWLLTLCTSAWAHNYWLRPVEGGIQVALGHGQETESYPKNSVKRLIAFDDKGQTLPSAEVFSEKDGLLIKAPSASGYLAEVDYGTWIKTIHGWKLGSKTDNGDRVLKSVWNLQYCKLVRPSTMAVNLGLPLEIVVERASSNSLQGRLLHQGRPATERPLFSGHERLGKTDDQGKFLLERSSASNLWVVTADIEEELPDHPQADRKSLTTTITVLF